MIQRKTLIMMAVLAALAGTGMAAAAESPTPDKAGPIRLDRNADGVIDRDEAAAHPRLLQQFDQLDRNHDGKLEKDEWPHPRGRMHGPKSGSGPRPVKAMARLDVDKDGRISQAEAQADPRLAARFAELDADKNGYLDKADAQARMRQWRDAWFAKADADHDGKLSKAEFDAAKGPIGMPPPGPGRHRHPGKAPVPPAGEDQRS